MLSAAACVKRLSPGRSEDQTEAEQRRRLISVGGTLLWANLRIEWHCRCRRVIDVWKERPTESVTIKSRVRVVYRVWSQHLELN